MGELAKIDSFRKELALAETIEQIKLLGDAALAYQFIIQRQGANKNKIDEIGEFNIEVECKKAEWLDTFYPHGATLKRGSEVPKENLGKMPVTKKESARALARQQYCCCVRPQFATVFPWNHSAKSAL